MIECRLEVLGNDPHIGKDRHEVGVTVPARDNMQMQMVDDTGTRDPAKIHPDIKPFGGDLFLENRTAQNQEPMHVQSLGIA
jgi:hypothetical protein